MVPPVVMNFIFILAPFLFVNSSYHLFSETSTLDKIPQIVKSMMAVANTFYEMVRGMILKPEKTAMYP